MKWLRTLLFVLNSRVKDETLSQRALVNLMLTSVPSGQYSSVHTGDGCHKRPGPVLTQRRRRLENSDATAAWAGLALPRLADSGPPLRGVPPAADGRRSCGPGRIWELPRREGGFSSQSSLFLFSSSALRQHLCFLLDKRDSASSCFFHKASFFFFLRDKNEQERDRDR